MLALKGEVTIGNIRISCMARSRTRKKHLVKPVRMLGNSDQRGLFLGQQHLSHDLERLIGTHALPDLSCTPCSEIRRGSCPPRHKSTHNRWGPFESVSEAYLKALTSFANDTARLERYFGRSAW